MAAIPGPSSTPKQASTTPKVQFGFTPLRRQEKPATTTVLAPLTLINKDFRQQPTLEDDDDGPEP